MQPKQAQTHPDEPASRDFTGERETTRAGQLSADDQAWEIDTRQRDRAAHQQQQVEEWESEGGAGEAGKPRRPDGEE